MTLEKYTNYAECRRYYFFREGEWTTQHFATAEIAWQARVDSKLEWRKPCK